MYRVIIADDEPWVAYRLIHLVSWADLGFEVIDTAINGIEAAQKCLDQKPDILISDIRMPGKDGLEIIKALRDEGMPIECVLISGYAEFDYAQRAIKLGAFDYLVKQVSREQLEALLLRLKNKLDERALGTEAVFALLDEDNETSIADWIPHESGFFGHANFQFCTFEIQEGEYPALRYLHADRRFTQTILRAGRKKATALLSFENAATLSEEWRDPSAYCGYSMIGTSKSSFYQLYRQSDIAFLTSKFLNHEKTLYIDQYDASYIMRLTMDLRAALKNREYGCVARTIRTFSIFCENLCLDKICDVYKKVLDVFHECGYLVDWVGESSDYHGILSEFASLDDLFQGFIDCLGGVPDVENVMPRIVKYVDENYTQDLRVHDLAQTFHFSPSYLSTLFKKHTGENFTSYIAEKRIAYSANLLRHSDLSIQEIADRSGYSDYFQFNKTFKRIQGITPGRYRRDSTEKNGRG